MRVALVVPNFRWCEWLEEALWYYLPYNLCLLAAMIEDICEVVIIDAYAAGMNKKQFKESLKAFKPDIVGITVHIDQHASAGHCAAEIVKSYKNDIKVVLGGAYATLNPNQAVRDPNIDYVVIGEGEYVFRDLLSYFIGKSAIPKKGICYRSNGKIVNTGPADFIQNLDELPLPAYHLIDFEKYASTISRKSLDLPQQFPYGRILTSRGCPFGCTFCQSQLISGKKYRARSAENTLNEIEWLRSKYGIKSLVFDDDNMLTDRRRAVEIFRGMIERKIAMPWFSTGIAVFKMDDEIIELMRASGCEYICAAIESGSERILKDIIKKPLDLEHAKKMVAKARKENIFVAANFIIGFPTETWDEIRQTIRLAEEMNADYVKIFNAAPLPHTKLWDLCKKEKTFKKKFKKTKVCWDLGQTETKDFSARDLTILRAYEWDRINFNNRKKRRRTAKMMGITEDELLQIRRKTLNRVSSYLKQS